MIVGALLAGGESRRMGRDKSALVIDGLTLAERALAVLRAVTDAQVILGHGRGCPADVPRLPDAEPNQGPSAGLRALLASGRGDVYLVLPVDMPGIGPEHLRRLLAARGLRPAACFSVAGEPTPLPCALAADATIATDERSLTALLGALGAVQVPLTAHEADALRNLNHPDDLATECHRRPPFG